MTDRPFIGISPEPGSGKLLHDVKTLYLKFYTFLLRSSGAAGSSKFGKVPKIY